MAQTINGALNINVFDGGSPVPVHGGTGVLSPDTGEAFGNVINNLGTVGCSLIVAALVLLTGAILLLCLRNKFFAGKRYNFIPGLVVLFLAGVILPSACANTATAIEETIGATINVTTNPTAPATATGTTTITLDAAHPDGYTVFAYLEGSDTALYNADHSVKIQATNPASTDPSSMTLNSYGAKDFMTGTYRPLDAQEGQQIALFTTGDSAVSGDKATIEYAVKVDNTIPADTYTSANSDLALKYTIKEGKFINVSTNADGVVDAQALVKCDKRNICEDIEGEAKHKYIDLDGDGVYVYAYDLGVSSNNEDWGTVTSIGVVPHGATLSTQGSELQADNVSIATATAQPPITGYSYQFANWTNVPTAKVTGPVSGIVANFTKQANTYQVNLNSGEGVTTAGTSTIYETYETQYSLDQSGTQVMTTSTNPITIPTKENYEFLGYYTEGEGQGTQYINKNGYITNDADAAYFTTDGNLYAAWKEKGGGGDFFSITTMQEMTSEICEAETTPYSSAIELTYSHTDDKHVVPTNILTDTRDNKTYRVSKLADGKCWMTQNLDLQLDKTKELNNTDTDLNTVETWTPLTSTGEWPKNSFDNTPRSLHPSDTEGYGTFYNWAATVASNENVSGKTAGTKMPNSICPKGWRLPTVITSGDGHATGSDYGTLTTTYGVTTSPTTQGNDDSKLLSSPLYFTAPAMVAGGYWYSGKPQQYLGTGWYWSDTAAGNDAVYMLIFGHVTMVKGVYPTYGDENDTSFGYSMRCVAH